MRSAPRRTFRLRPSTLAERNFIADALRTETVGGSLLLIAAVVALVWANSGWSGSYEDLRDATVGPASLHLDLSLGTWASDGLLAIFFFVAGIELKRELVVGELRSPSAAVLPVVAAVCGMAVPALFYFSVNAGGGQLDGWAIPTATDIAFALGVLAVISTNLPTGLRAFLLTLAVVDDLLAIVVIAVFYTDRVKFGALGLAVAGLAVFALMQRFRVRGWWFYLPLAVVTWALVHESGVHATVAGVAMGLLMRVRPDRDEAASPAERVEHVVRPISAGFAVPVFALFAAGVAVSGSVIGDVFTHSMPLGVVLGLVFGKTIGIFCGTYLTARFTRARLGDDLTWPDVFGLAMLAGVGFTVSLLISELAFHDSPALVEQAKAAVLVGSVISALAASVLLRLRDNKYRALAETENRDDDGDGIPDIHHEDAERARRAKRDHIGDPFGDSFDR
ncbi:Na+/H+ antiporter NhaA [Yinghuangia sp. ASG 101]|uniref:Na+/H+ antiporter NhaA n=1 Tax=Yinghuangia sp. ASG 101 TaxID=2896848 RepID=UPI001E4978E7|nr:Na+/H+ antiporter NhaA [Yinghuangia sp. ASG 101]UGQ09093.1 Na+/H+ antiporter NhaA [Yinghuangia sp. ASG 101]